MGLWKAIRRGWDAFKSKISYFVGNERRVIFSKDIWYEDIPLRTSFPSLFTMPSQRMLGFVMLRSRLIVGVFETLISSGISKTWNLIVLKLFFCVCKVNQ